jgi:hypothetical protein
MHNVTVSFAGDAAYQAASRTTTALTVKARSALSFYAANGSLGGTTLLKAILVSGSARLSGKSVTFWVAGAPAGSGITDASGVAQASWTIPLTLGAGSHNVTATFDGDATYASTTRTAAVLAVARASTVLSFYGASGSTGQTVALRCILFSGSARVAGKSVAFSVDGVAAGSGTTDANGVATVGYLLPALSTGVHSVTAFFGGDATYAAATRTAAVLTVK